ncbi:MAG TPA: cupin domain-containing protein [Solirubrobacteraceae bacterium]|nr:cupin domain-containing protein [Solirubrobacteraceae bacterium]
MTRTGVFDALAPEQPYPGIDRRVLGTEKATVQQYRFDAGATFPLHRHPQEQTTLVIEGEVALTAGGETRTLAAGGWSIIPGEVEHGITAGPAGARFIAILVPPRKEPLP